ncbi:PSP1 domain containing protein [Nitzschia inconspicua]|uniref:PSP1 domain containing protein n=1 Tax=Nitzschia inconspicua TaxID=303405 RepID=A0A9K3KTJ7_9STRA|nr:PSP1 domain containing protein [Nitzschia inconspicua]
MAANGPPPDLPTSWVTDNKSDPSFTRVLELGMSGMSLLPSTTATAEDHIRSSGDSVHSYHSVGTASSAPTKLSRPPGLSVPPIDGGATSGNDMFALTGGMGRHQASSPPSDHLPGISSLSVVGSFETDDGDHDGLLGLQALRDRAYSSPGPPPYSTSPRELGGIRSVISSQQGRPRTVSKDSGRSQSGSRPPLAGGVALSPHTGGDLSGYGPGNRSRDASPPPTAGIISRPYSPYGSGGGSVGGGGSMSVAGNEYDRNFDSSLRRAFISDSANTTDNGGGNHAVQVPALPFNAHNRTNSGGHLHAQAQLNMYQPQRVQRSQSQPGPLRGVPPPDQYFDEGPGMNRRRGDHGQSGIHGSYPVPTRGGGMEHEFVHYDSQDMRYGGAPANHNRSMSMQLSSSNPSFHDMHRRGSNGYYGGGPRRDEYDDGRRYHEQERIGNTSYPRQDRLVSPAHSPMHGHYGSHSRASSDMGSTFSSSPMSLASGNQPLYGRHRISHSDEDLSHPLVGEHIEVPGEEQYYNDSMLPYPRSASIGHPPSYGFDSHHLPSVGSSMSMPKDLYNVKFKRTQRVFEIGPRLNRDLKVGTYVKVEADRGEDLGIVVGKVKNPSVRSASFAGGIGELIPPGSSGDLKKITRLATHDEVSLLQIKREEEEDLLKVCRTKVRQRGLPMHVVDAEYQFDRHKLTFFFEAEGRIDFRELVRDLFSMYKTRIWMQQLDKSTTAVCPVAPAPAPLVIDYGTPIIAPASEYEEFASGTSDDHYTD